MFDTAIGGEYVVDGDTIKITTYAYKHGKQEKFHGVAARLRDLYSESHEVCAAVLAYLGAHERPEEVLQELPIGVLRKFSSYLDACLLGNRLGLQLKLHMESAIRLSRSPILHYLQGLLHFVWRSPVRVQTKYLKTARDLNPSFLPAYFPYELPQYRSACSANAWTIAQSAISRCPQYREGWVDFLSLGILEGHVEKIVDALRGYVACWKDYAFHFLTELLLCFEEQVSWNRLEHRELVTQLIAMITASFRRLSRRTVCAPIRPMLRAGFAVVLDTQAELLTAEMKFGQARQTIARAMTYVPLADTRLRNVLRETAEAIDLAEQRAEGVRRRRSESGEAADLESGTILAGS